MDVSGINSILTSYQTLLTQSYSVDSSTTASTLASRLLANRDSDSDGYLTASDLSEMSASDFSKLDSDGDGKLSSDELTSAFKSQLDAITLATQTNSIYGARTLAVLRNAPAGQLMRLVNVAAASSSSATTSSSTTTSSSSGDSSSLDVTA